MRNNITAEKALKEISSVIARVGKKNLVQFLSKSEISLINKVILDLRNEHPNMILLGDIFDKYTNVHNILEKNLISVQE